MTPFACAKETASHNALEDAQAFGVGRLVAQIVIEPPTAHELHRIKRATVGERAHVVHGHDARMLEARQDLRLAHQPVDRVGRQRERPDDLERDETIERAVARDVDGAHTTMAERFDELVLRVREIGDLADHLQSANRDVGQRPAHHAITPRRRADRARLRRIPRRCR